MKERTRLTNPTKIKRIITLNLGATVDSGLSLKIPDQAVLQWAWDFAHSGNNQSVEHEGKVYYWLKYSKCRSDLPTLGINSDEGIKKKFQSFCKAGLLIPHPKRLTFGAYYTFTRETVSIMALTSPRDQLTNSIVKTVKIYRALSEVFSSPGKFLPAFESNEINEDILNEILNEAFSSPGKFLPDDNENKGHLVNFYQGLSEKIAKGGTFLPPIVV